MAVEPPAQFPRSLSGTNSLARANSALKAHVGDKTDGIQVIADLARGLMRRGVDIQSDSRQFFPVLSKSKSKNHRSIVDKLDHKASGASRCAAAATSPGSEPAAST